MKVNEHAALSTSRLLLVPYSEHHVPRYHAWMQDPGLQALTASEPLTLDEEYAMQRSWRTDRDKLTFIVCLPLSKPSMDNGVRAGVDDTVENMIGDINLFLFQSEEQDSDCSGLIGEIELMIASEAYRRQGYGRAALLALFDYIRTSWADIADEYGSPMSTLQYLRAKIHESNGGSIKLFESMGFVKTKDGTNYFGEVELRQVPTRAGNMLNEDRANFVVLQYRADGQRSL